jgi:hypothetical protein
MSCLGFSQDESPLEKSGGLFLLQLAYLIQATGSLAAYLMNG